MVNKEIKKYIYSKLGSDKTVVFEVGAHFGEDSIDFLSTMNPSAVYCFEPDTRNIQVFEKYVTDDRIELIKEIGRAHV